MPGKCIIRGAFIIVLFGMRTPAATALTSCEMLPRLAALAG